MTERISPSLIKEAGPFGPAVPTPVTLPMIGRLLGHANHQSTARYAHLDDEHLLDVVQQVGDAVERLLGGSLLMLR